MANEIQFLLYNMPDEEGKVQVVMKKAKYRSLSRTIRFGLPKRQWYNFLELECLLSASI